MLSQWISFWSWINCSRISSGCNALWKTFGLFHSCVVILDCRMVDFIKIPSEISSNRMITDDYRWFLKMYKYKNEDECKKDCCPNHFKVHWMVLYLVWIWDIIFVKRSQAFTLIFSETLCHFIQSLLVLGKYVVKWGFPNFIRLKIDVNFFKNVWNLERKLQVRWCQ